MVGWHPLWCPEWRVRAHTGWGGPHRVTEKIINWSKKLMENFTQARFEDYNLGRVSLKVLRTTLPVRSPGTGNNVLSQRGGHHWHIIVSLYNPDLSIILAPYKIKNFQGGTNGKESACQCRRHRSSIPGSGRSPGVGNDNPIQYSYLENYMDGEASQAIVMGSQKSQIQLNN